MGLGSVPHRVKSRQFGTVWGDAEGGETMQCIVSNSKRPEHKRGARAREARGERGPRPKTKSPV